MLTTLPPTNSKGRSTDNTCFTQRLKVPDQHLLSEDPSDGESEEDSTTGILEELAHTLGKRKKSS